MGKKRGLGIKRAVSNLESDYQQYHHAVNLMMRGENPFPGVTKKLRNKTDNAASDDAPPAPNASSRMQGFTMANAKRHSDTIIECPYRRGVGYKKPGPIFLRGARQIKQQFALELTSAINHRQFTRMLFRSYAQFKHRVLANQPATVLSKTLSPASLSRTINGYTISTPVRDGNMSSLPTPSVPTITYETSNRHDMFLPVCTLQDLEVASWNANPIKYISFNMENGYTEGAGTAIPTLGNQFKPLQVLADWRLDKTIIENGTSSATTTSVGCTSPFDTLPTESNSYGGFTQRPENYLCDLGPGYVKLHFQNRLNTSAEIEIVVCRMRFEPGVTAIPGSLTDNLWISYEDQLDKAYLSKFNSGSFISSGFNGEQAVSKDLLVNPTKPFLKCFKKNLDRESVMIEVSRDRFRIQGGSTRKTTIKLPEITYDPWNHRRWNYNWSANDNSMPADVFSNGFYNVWPHSYVVYISTQGVLMPVFPATSTSGVVTAVGATAVDTQVSPSSVLIHGEYVENPRPCLSVSPTSVVQTKPELADAKISGANAVLLSGYVADPPVATSTAPVITTGT